MDLISTISNQIAIETTIQFLTMSVILSTSTLFIMHKFMKRFNTAEYNDYVKAFEQFQNGEK